MAGKEINTIAHLRTEGELRRLTIGEVALARSIFGNYINYSKVWIHYDSYLPFGTQDKYTAMTPNGELYFRGPLYCDDFSVEVPAKKHLFMHEMTHVWQYQNGVWVKLRGSMSWAANYHYDFKGKIRLSEYSMEQQAALVADYFYLLNYGEAEWRGHQDLYYNGDIDENVSSFYKLILTDFPNH